MNTTPYRGFRFPKAIIQRLRRRRGRPSNIWHLDEMFVRIGGRQMYLWRAIDSEGEILDMLVQSRRDKRAALRLLRKLLKTQGMAPEELVTGCGRMALPLANSV